MEIIAYATVRPFQQQTEYKMKSSLKSFITKIRLFFDTCPWGPHIILVAIGFGMYMGFGADFIYFLDIGANQPGAEIIPAPLIVFTGLMALYGLFLFYYGARKTCIRNSWLK